MLVTCANCKEEKPLEEFYQRARVSSGHSARCKACLQTDQKGYRQERQKNKQESATVFPMYRCDKCHKLVQLDFDPTKDFTRWSFFNCPNCYSDE